MPNLGRHLSSAQAQTALSRMWSRTLVSGLLAAAVVLSVAPIGSAEAQTQISAASVYTPVRGAGGPLTPPDANGDSFGGFFDGGFIVGAFSAQASCVPPSCGNFSRQVSFVLHTSTNEAEGTGTALCAVCVVSGLKGTVSFALTLFGHGVTSGGQTSVAIDGGTWNITRGTSDLVGISGAGTWTLTADGGMALAGEITVPGGDLTITASGNDVSATEGLATTTNVATFTDPDATATAAEYSANIDWGDGSSSSGTIASAGGGNFMVAGTHKYVEEGSYTTTVVITDSDNSSNSATTQSTARVADAPVTATPGCAMASPADYNGPTAMFTDSAGTFGSASDFAATINWGDGATSRGVITAMSDGSYDVTGLHSYTALGRRTITTTIADDGDSSATTSCSTTVFAFSAGGAFVIGNLSHSGKVIFWGAQWARANSLDGGPAPSAFKGFEDSAALPACAATWTTDPGNSGAPPETLPGYMAVIVSGSISQSGSRLTGDTVQVVVVKTDPGYAPDVGHMGTGTVVATIC